MQRIKNRSLAATLILFLLVGTIVYAEDSGEKESTTQSNLATNLNIEESEQITPLCEKESTREEVGSVEKKGTSRIPTLDHEKESTQENDSVNQEATEKMEPAEECVTDEKETIEESNVTEEPPLEKQIEEISTEEAVGEEVDLPYETIKEEESSDMEMDSDEEQFISEKLAKLETNTEERLLEQQGVGDVKLLSNTQLTAQYTESSIEGGKKITLYYTGSGVLGLDLLKQSYIIFQVPEEIEKFITNESLTVSYDIAILSLLGIELLKVNGDFNNENIMIDRNRNLIYVKYGQLLGLVVGSGAYEFTLEIELDTLPLSPTGTYTFYAEATKQIIELSILSDETIAKATLDSPVLKFEQVPETITFQSTQIGSKPGMIGIKNFDQPIEVLDTRGQGGTWRVQASILEPLTTIESTYSLPNALGYMKEGGEFQPLSEDPIDVYLGETEINSLTTIRSDDIGLFIQVNPSNIYAEEYSTTIHWTLIDAP